MARPKTPSVLVSVQPFPGGLDDRVDEGEHTEPRQRRSDEVERTWLGIPAFRDKPNCQEDRDDCDRDVDEEDRVPAEPVQKQAAEERPEADADRGHRRPDADRLRAFLTREDVRDDREGRRHDQRSADAHDCSKGDQLAGGADGDDGHARPGEHDEPGQERSLAPEPIAKGSGREQEAGEREEVGVHHPLERRPGGVKVMLQGRQCDVEDRVVEPDDHQAQREHAEGLPSPGVDRAVHGGAVCVGSHRCLPRVGRGTVDMGRAHVGECGRGRAAPHR